MSDSLDIAPADPKSATEEVDSNMTSDDACKPRSNPKLGEWISPVSSSLATVEAVKSVQGAEEKI